MSILTQKTVSKKISLDGIGIHTGVKAHLDILPANPNSGIIFKRVDIERNNIIIPTYNNVVDATLCTTITNEFGQPVGLQIDDDELSEGYKDFVIVSHTLHH